MGAALAVLAATHQAVDIPYPPLAPDLLQEPDGNAAPSSSAALSSRAAVPVGYGNSAFVQQLSSIVSSLEQNLVAVQEIKQAAAKEAEAQRLVRPQLADTHAFTSSSARRSLPTLNRTQELAEEFLGSRAPTRRLQAELREQVVALRQKQSSAQALEESLSEREQQLAGRERYAPSHAHCPCRPFFCWAALIPGGHSPARSLAHPCASPPQGSRACEIAARRALEIAPRRAHGRRSRLRGRRRGRGRLQGQHGARVARRKRGRVLHAEGKSRRRLLLLSSRLHYKGRLLYVHLLYLS